MTFAERVAAMRPQLIAYARRWFPQCRDQAEDMVQNTIVNALRLGEEVCADTSDKVLFNWLRVILRREALRAMDRARQQSQEVIPNEAAEKRQASWREAQSRESRDKILREIDGLPDQERDVITWLYSFGWSIDRVAFELNSTPNAVARLKARAMHRLKEMLRPGDFTSLTDSL